MDTRSDPPQPDADIGPGIIFKHAKFPHVKTVARINVSDDESNLVDAIYTENLPQSFLKPHEPIQFFDCKFYPYTAPGVDPVFVVTGGAEVSQGLEMLLHKGTQCGVVDDRYPAGEFGGWI